MQLLRSVRSDDVSDVELRDQEEVSQEEDRESVLWKVMSHFFQNVCLHKYYERFFKLY